MDLKRIAAATLFYEEEEEGDYLSRETFEDCIDTYLSLVENNRETFERVYRCMLNDIDFEYFDVDDVDEVSKKFNN